FRTKTGRSLSQFSPSRTEESEEEKRRAMSGEELAGPPAPKLLRLLYFFFALLESINGVSFRTSQFYSSNSSLKMPQMPLSDLQMLDGLNLNHLQKHSFVGLSIKVIGLADHINT
ncbi:hypothetical protein Prudu_004953, partial [Prunus dulcis]